MNSSLFLHVLHRGRSHLECEEVQVPIGSREQQSASLRRHRELLDSGFIQTWTQTRQPQMLTELTMLTEENAGVAMKQRSLGAARWAGSGGQLGVWPLSQDFFCLLTSDSVNRCDSALHHVVQVEHLVLQTGGDHCLSVAAELGRVDREALQVDALDLRVGLPIHLQENTSSLLSHMIFSFE